MICRHCASEADYQAHWNEMAKLGKVTDQRFGRNDGAHQYCKGCDCHHWPSGTCIPVGETDDPGTDQSVGDRLA